jgi:hypothetical protein
MPDYGTVTLYTLPPKQLFGWSSLITGRRKKSAGAGYPAHQNPVD